MPKPCSEDLRERVIEAVAEGSSRRAAGERFAVSASSAVRWVQRWHQSGSAAVTRRGGRQPALEEHAGLLLALIEEEPDLTLDELREQLRAQDIGASRSRVWRFCARHGISFKKNRARRGAGTRRRGRSAPALERRSTLA